MDLTIKIIDENGDTLEGINIYCDGSDSENAEKIINAISDMYQDADKIGCFGSFNDKQYPRL